jgi:hypothetical protein
MGRTVLSYGWERSYYVRTQRIYQQETHIVTSLHLVEGDSATIDKGKRIQVRGAYHHIGDFAVIYNYGFDKASRACDEAAVTLNAIVARVEHPNKVYIRAAHLVRLLGKSRSTIERHLAKIRELHIIRPDAVDENLTSGKVVWRICPFIVWKGKNEELRAYERTLPLDDPWFDYKEQEST